MTIIFIIIDAVAPRWYVLPETQSPHLLPPCTIPIFNFNEHKRVSDKWFSPPFYSGPDEYKLQLTVHANGMDSGKDTHVSVGVSLMKGEYDESLNWPFNSEISIQVLNWREDKGHVEKIIPHYRAEIAARTRVVDGERAPNFAIRHDFISHKELEYSAGNNTEYLNKDTLCFRVSKVTVHTGIISYMDTGGFMSV